MLISGRLAFPCLSSGRQASLYKQSRKHYPNRKSHQSNPTRWNPTGWNPKGQVSHVFNFSVKTADACLLAVTRKCWASEPHPIEPADLLHIYSLGNSPDLQKIQLYKFSPIGQID